MTISVAIVGAGRTGGWHRRDLTAIDDVRLVGIADIRRAMAERLAGDSGAAVYTDYQEMLERLKPDVVYLCTPASEHAAQLRFAAERGINVFVEKPLAASVADARAAAEAVRRHNILCTVGYQWRYNPATDAARAALGDAAVTLLAGWWYWTIPVIAWIKDRRYGGGQIFDQATHLIDLMRSFAGEIDTIYAAYTRNALDEAALPNWDANAVTLRFAQGAVGSVHTSYALFPGIPNSNGLDVIAQELLLRVNLGKTTIFRRDAAPEERTAPAGWNIDQAFMAIVRRNDASAIRATAPDAARSVAATLAANYSAETGQVVRLDEFFAAPPETAIMPSERPNFVTTHG